LLLQGGGHVTGGQAAGGEADGVNPEAHGVLAFAEDLGVADSGDPAERILDIDVDVIGDELFGEAVVGGIEAEHKDEIGARLGDGDAGVLNFLRQPALRCGDAVLYIDGTNVDVVAGPEEHVDGAATVIGAGGSDVAHALNTVDLLFERKGYGRLNSGGIGADVIATDGDLRRGKLGIE